MPANKTNYQQKLQPVIRYLEMNFKQLLNLKEVAEKHSFPPIIFTDSLKQLLMKHWQTF